MEHFYTDNELTALSLIKIIFSSFSILWAAIIFILYWYFKDLRQFKIEIIKWLSFSCILTHITHFFPISRINEESSRLCSFQAFAINALGISTKIWVILILYSGILEYSYEDYLRNFNTWVVRLIYNLLGFGIGIAVSIPMIFIKSHRNIGAWCSIDSISTRASTKLTVFYLFISWFFILVSIYLTYQFYKMKKIEDKKLKQDLFQSIYSWIIFYPIILVICHIPHTIRVYFSIYRNETPYWIILAETIGCSMQGFLLALTFITSPFIREALVICIKRIFGFYSTSQPANRSLRQGSINSLISSYIKKQ